MKRYPTTQLARGTSKPGKNTYLHVLLFSQLLLLLYSQKQFLLLLGQVVRCRRLLHSAVACNAHTFTFSNGGLWGSPCLLAHKLQVFIHNINPIYF